MQVYLSDEERSIFESMLKREGCTRSELVRNWLQRAQAQYARRHRPKDEKRADAEASPAADPRQLDWVDQ